MAVNRGNLQAITPALMTGRGGRMMTPEEIARDREIAAALIAKGSDTSPVQHWTQGLARLVEGWTGGMRDRRANEAAGANAQKSSDLIASLLSGTPSTGGGASTSAGLDLSGGPAISPAPASAPAMPSGQTASYIRDGLIARGLPEHVADGFLANFQDESGLNPGINEANPIVPGSRGGYGLYQLTGPRRQAYEAFSAANNTPLDSIDGQLDFLVSELKGPEANAAKSIFAAPDTATAAQAVLNDFLRPAEAHRAERAARYAALGGQAPVQIASLDPAPGMSGGAPAARSPDPIAAALVPSYQQQPYTAPPIRMVQTAPQAMNPAVIEAITSPFVDDRTREIGKLIMQRDLGAQQAASNRAFEIDKLREGRAYENWQRGDQRSYDAFVRGDQRLYDDNVRQQGFARDDRIRGENNARTDERNAYLDARQGSRDARADYQADRDFNRQVENDKKPPTSILEYEYAKQQGYAGTFAEWEAQNRKAAASNVNINNGEGDKFYENLDKKNAERFSLLSDGGQDARSRLGQLNQLDALLKESPSGWEAIVKRAAGEYGFNTDGLSSLQATEALIEKMVPAQREPGAGSLSDADIAGFRRSLPRVINQPGGNELILGTAKAIAQYDIKRGEIADMVADRAITPAEGRQRLRELENPLASYSKLIQDMGVSGDGPRVSGSTPRSKDGVPVGAAMNAQQPPQPASRAAYDALPSGATFMAPDGSIRKKP